MLKAKPKGADGWQDYSQCTIGISIGNKNCQGDSLQAIVNWLNTTSNFQVCMIDLSDSLNRHNFMVEEGIDEKTARAKAIAAGDQWLEDNQHILDTLKIPYKVTRWEEWRNDPKVAEYQAQFYNAFKTDATFRQAVFADVERYHKRHERSAWDFENFTRMPHSITYLLEELAVHSRIYDNGLVASIYPGDQQESFRLVRNGTIGNVPEGMKNSHFVKMNVYDPDPRKPANDINLKDDDQGSNGTGTNGHGVKTTPAVRGSFRNSGAPQGSTAPRPPAKPNRTGTSNATKAASREALPLYQRLLGLTTTLPRYA